MPLLPIILIAVILIADGGVRLWPSDPVPSFGQALLIVSCLHGTVLTVLAMLIWRCRRRLNREGHARAIMTAERAARHSRWAILIIHTGSVLTLGWLDAVRSVIGNPILIDELIVLLPAVIGVLGTWVLFYPIERRIREALLLRRLDYGHAIHPMPTRGRYVWEQARIGLLLLLVPLLLIVGLTETIRMAAMRLDAPETARHLIDAATFIAAACVFILAPLLARFTLGVRSLPDGQVRQVLLDICDRHRVRVRDILLWHTGGSMINAAVMGLFGRLRYVLLTDALLESMSLTQLKAVMAHEVGHVRRHHMPWMVLSILAILIGTAALIELPLQAAQAMGVLTVGPSDWGMAALVAVQLVIVLIVFGWISRRFERQADTFAVVHLSETWQPTDSEADEPIDLFGIDMDDRARDITESPPTPPPSRDGIHPDAVESMCSALQSVAELNAVDPRRPSWRHGSIAWRQSYLRSIVGRRSDELCIDAVVRRIKIASAVTVCLGLAAWIALL